MFGTEGSCCSPPEQQPPLSLFPPTVLFFEQHGNPSPEQFGPYTYIYIYVSVLYIYMYIWHVRIPCLFVEG